MVYCQTLFFFTNKGLIVDSEICIENDAIIFFNSLKKTNISHVWTITGVCVINKKSYNRIKIIRLV